MKNLGLSEYQMKIAEEMGLLESEEASKAATPITTTQMTDAAGVGLSVEVPDSFIDLVVDESVLLKQVRVYRTKKPSGNLAKIMVNGHITEQASENGTSTETRAHTPGSVEYVNKKLRSQFDITTEAEEDNIEGSSGVSTIMGALMKAIANDMECLAIEGDDSLGGSDDRSRLLKSNDGWHVQTANGTGTNIVNCAGRRPSWLLLSAMIKALPTRFRSGTWKSQYKWIMSPNVAQLLREEARPRETALGDAVYSGADIKPHGIDIMEIPLLPEDMTISGTQSVGSFIWLANPKNFIYVIQRGMVVHRFFNQRYDRNEFTVFSRNDFIIEDTKAIVKSPNVSLDTALALYGA